MLENVWLLKKDSVGTTYILACCSSFSQNLLALDTDQNNNLVCTEKSEKVTDLNNNRVSP